MRSAVYRIFYCSCLSKPLTGLVRFVATPVVAGVPLCSFCFLSLWILFLGVHVGCFPFAKLASVRVCFLLSSVACRGVYVLLNVGSMLAHGMAFACAGAKRQRRYTDSLVRLWFCLREPFPSVSFQGVGGCRTQRAAGAAVSLSYFIFIAAGGEADRLLLLYYTVQGSGHDFVDVLDPYVVTRL